MRWARFSSLLSLSLFRSFQIQYFSNISFWIWKRGFLAELCVKTNDDVVNFRSTNKQYSCTFVRIGLERRFHRAQLIIRSRFAISLSFLLRFLCFHLIFFSDEKNNLSMACSITAWQNYTGGQWVRARKTVSISKWKWFMQTGQKNLIKNIRFGSIDREKPTGSSSCLVRDWEREWKRLIDLWKKYRIHFSSKITHWVNKIR